MMMTVVMMMNKSARAFLRLLVLCLCFGGMIAVEETRPSANGDPTRGIKLSPLLASSPIAGHNWKYPRDEQQQHEQHEALYQPLRLMHGHADAPSLRGVDRSESTLRRPFDTRYLTLEEEEAPAWAAASSSAPASSGYSQGNDLPRNPANNNNVPADDDDDDPELAGQLNLHEAQLARLHGLGPAEIEALYNWQQRMRIPPMFNRNPAHHPADNGALAVKRSKAGADSGRRELAAQRSPPLNSADTPSLHDPANLKEKAESANDTSGTPATWPKRSSSDMKKTEKDAVGSKARGGYNRKEKTERGKGGKNNPRRQQSQESVPHFDNPPNKGAKDAGSYEHVRGGQGAPPDVSRMNRNLATQFLLRSPRENRQYDVPIIECPPAEDGMERFACPTPDIVGRYRCIDDHVLCDGFIDCPGGEDEDGQACMFYKTMKAHLDLVADALLRWVRGR